MELVPIYKVDDFVKLSSDHEDVINKLRESYDDEDVKFPYYVDTESDTIQLDRALCIGTLPIAYITNYFPLDYPSMSSLCVKDQLVFVHNCQLYIHIRDIDG